MFIIDQFEVRDEGGEAITLDTSSVGGTRWALFSIELCSGV